MFEPPDYTAVEGTEAAHRGFYPTQRWTPPPQGAVDVEVPVAEEVEIGCRFYPGEAVGPNILYFHGNGETVGDYDGIAPLFTRLGVNLFVADYRGYGSSSGSPSFPTMVSDAHIILGAFQALLRTRGLAGKRFVMGRSLGGHSAVELAAHHPAALAGLILESSAPNVARLVEYLIATERHSEAAELEERHLGKVRAITIPALSIHGEWDELIPLHRAILFFETMTMSQKKMEIIPRAGHNDILWVGTDQYLNAVRAFVDG